MTVTLESFSNNSSTTLSSALTDTTGTSVAVTSAAGFPSSGNYRILIDNELMTVTGGQGTTTWTVARGAEGSTAATHSNAAAVTQVLTNGGLLQARSDLYLLDTWANRPAAGVKGRLFKTSDGERVWRDNGSSWEVFGFGAAETAVPTTGWSWDNQNSATIGDDVDGTSLMTVVTNNSQWSVRYRTLAAGSYTLIAMVEPGPSLDNNSYYGICLRNAGSGKYIYFYAGYNVSGANNMYLEYWASVNGAVTNKVNSQTGHSPFPIRWFKVVDNGTNRAYSYSHDGVNWKQIYTAVNTEQIVPDGCGFMGQTASANYPEWVKLRSWSGVA